MASMNHVLIGGSGFIGSMLSQMLINRGDAVTSVSKSGNDSVDGVTSVTVDLYAAPCPNRILDNADTVIILIGQTHTAFDSRLEKQTLQRLADQLKDSQARVYYASTTLVYGDVTTPADETTPVNPIGAYSTFKAEAETILQELIPPDRLTIFRFANVYGTPKNRGIIGLLMQKSNENPIELSLNDDGQQTRDYIFVDDLVSSILHIVDKPEESGITNVATGITHTLIEVVNEVSRVLGKPIGYSVTHLPVEEPHDNRIENIRLQTVFGITKFTPLATGLVQTYSRYKDL